ncbi:YSC84-related protein [Pseudoroseicyclus sp. CXY001]|uniref:lipid-binding SYLF domain-containing protein n=1 Tax=Pseudoroseicyclus sp. CXY001 TaxID=3242492 RepID=UPI00358DBCAB
MTPNRRTLLAGAGATLASLSLAACGNGIGSPAPTQIDARVDATLQHMFSAYPGTVDISNQAAGMLVMPLITEAGLGLGGSYGRGALRVGGATVDYYLATAASAGLQIGAQQYSHVLFFMTQDALLDFRAGNGWSAGGDIEYAIPSQGEMLRADALTSLSPVIAVVFAQAGLRVGATVEGTKYTRIIP